MQEALSDAQAAAQTEAARKSYQLTSHFEKPLDFAHKHTPAELDKSFASFITGGK